MSQKMPSINIMASVLKSLHKPGQPLVLANVYDILSARAVASLPSCKALATASNGIASANGVKDDEMDLETNIRAVKKIARVAAERNKPLTVDIQDGYGEQLEQAISELLQIGVAGVNLEDCNKATQEMYTMDQAIERIKRSLQIADKYGAPDFVVNARCDTLLHGGQLEEVLARGKAYLAAGATSVLVWGGSKRGVTRDEVLRMVEDFEGRLNVILIISPSGLGVRELSNIGVSRISVGHQIQFMAMNTFAKEAEKILAYL
jgi:2-methylisocitrate lyase-like PEP mutase family enzyme